VADPKKTFSSLEEAVKHLGGKWDTKSEVLLASEGGWKTIFLKTEAEHFIVKSFPKSEGSSLYESLSGEFEITSEDPAAVGTFHMLVAAANQDSSLHLQMAYVPEVDDTTFLVMKLPEEIRCDLADLDDNTKELVALSSIDIPKDNEGRWSIQDVEPALRGRQALLFALTHTDRTIIDDLSDAVVDRLGTKYWKPHRNKGAAIPVAQSLELLHKREQPLRHGESVWAPPWEEEPIKAALEQVLEEVDQMGEKDVSLPTLRVEKSHGDLNSSNIIFTIRDDKMKAYLVDPYYMTWRVNKKNIMCLKSAKKSPVDSNKKIRFWARHLYSHKPRPVPCALNDVTHLMACTLISLPFQMTTNPGGQNADIEREKTQTLIAMTRKLHDSFIDVFTDTPKRDHITNNLSIFIHKLQKSVISKQVAHHSDDEDRLEQHFTLLLIEKIIYKAGFVLRELDGKKKQKETFVNYVASLIALVVNK